MTDKQIFKEIIYIFMVFATALLLTFVLGTLGHYFVVEMSCWLGGQSGCYDSYVASNLQCGVDL